MYVCNDCTEVFEKPITVVEKHGLDDPPYERIPSCPRCGSPDIAVAVQCTSCGEYTASNYIITDDGNTYCENCFTFVKG